MQALSASTASNDKARALRRAQLPEGFKLLSNAAEMPVLPQRPAGGSTLTRGALQTCKGDVNLNAVAVLFSDWRHV